MNLFKLFTTKLPLSASGLYNLGNTCFMNSIIQCLAHTPTLYEFALSYRFSSFETTSQKNQIFTQNLTESLIELIQLIHSGNEPIKPVMFYEVFAQINAKYRKKQQRDAAEFLMLLFEVMDNDTRNLSLAQPPPIIHIGEYYDKYRIFMEANFSITTMMFNGMTVVKNKCSKCPHQHISFEPFTVLELPIPTDLEYLKIVDPFHYIDHENLDYITVYDCLNNYYYSKSSCPSCETSFSSEKQFVVTPPILVIQFLRFTITKSKPKKDERFIYFPLQNLSIGKAEYELYATVEHTGNTNFGHYVANCIIDDKWYRFNDDKVSEIDKKEIVSKNSYLLFYKRMPNSMKKK